MLLWTLRTIVFALLIAITAPLWAAPASRLKSPVGIRGSAVIDVEGQIVRGPTPGAKAAEFPRAGITDILIIKKPSKNEVDLEIERLVALGYSTEQITHIPMAWKDSSVAEVCQHTVEALRKLVEIDSSRNRRLYFHCTAGEDRTGLVAGLFRMLSQDWAMERAFSDEMCPNGYAEGNSKKPVNVAKMISATLTPTFVGLGRLIERKTLTVKNLDGRVCSSRAFQSAVRAAASSGELKTWVCPR